MRILPNFMLLLVLVLSLNHSTFAQELSPADRENLRAAEKLADHFVVRFRQTLKTVWKEFQVSNPSCTYKLVGFFGEEYRKKLKINDALLEKLYLDYMNYFYLKGVYALSVIRLYPDANVSEKDFTPKDALTAERKAKYIRENGKEPRNAKEIEEMLLEIERIAELYRKHMPRNVMKSAAWQANTNYLMNRGGIIHSDVFNGDSTFCIPENVKVYVVDRGIFYFYIVEEKGEMKIAGLSMDIDST
jgi:hypothetical protein